MAAKKKTREPTAEERAGLEKLRKTYEHLLEVRKSTTLTLKPTPLLRTEIEKDGAIIPFKLRYYQYIGIYHLLAMKRLILGDGTGLGKTIQVLAALAYLWPKEPDNKVIVVTPKSALWQWAGEIKRFTTGIRPIVAAGKPEERIRAYEEFRNAPTGPDAEKVVLLVNYSILVRDWDSGSFKPTLPNGKPDPKAPVAAGLFDRITADMKGLCIIYDEATAFKNTGTKRWQVCRYLSDRASRCYGLTATLLKNNLMEGFSIFKVIQPPLFGTKSAFMDEYCVVKLQSVPGGRKIPIVVGYRRLAEFRNKIDPFFIGRAKHMVSNELPKLITKEIVCELSPAEDTKYGEALSGVLMLGDGEVKDYSEAKAMASLIYCQEIVNSLALLKFKAGDEVSEFALDENPDKVNEQSAKEEALVELLTTELEDEKVIIYTRFEKYVTRLVEVLNKLKIKSVRITGKENDKARQEAQKRFQDLASDTKVVFITDAGSEAINLQAASAMVFMDAPWSYGNYVQLLGRPVRIGSIHSTVMVYHIVAVRPGKTAKEKKTIDHHVLELLHGKKNLVDTVLGEAALGALSFEKEKSSAKDLLGRMRAT
jgi:SNF2 family DNA or RNA helicase